MIFKSLLISVYLIIFIDDIVCNNHEAKIVGGKPIPVERFPFTVQFFNVGALCAGSIINSWSVLTAAHCFDGNTVKDDMFIQVGSRYVYDFTAKQYHVAHFVRHEDYNKMQLFACDVALIFVNKPIKFGERTKRAILVNHNKWMNPKEKYFEATGWGWTQYGGPLSKVGLMMTHLQYITAKECSKMHKMELSPDMFCLYGEATRDTCKGDSGGGVIWKGMVVGIVSYGDGCAKKDKPSIYSNVWYFRDWIRRTIFKYINTYCKNK